MKIVSLNVNAWNHNLSKKKLGDRLPDIAAYIREVKPDICCLQEMIAGRNGIFINQLIREFPDYEIILPQFDIRSHWKSIISVICVAKAFTVEHVPTLLSLPGFELANRYNYIDFEDFRILNLHIPQTSEFSGAAKWYVQERLRLASESWKAVEDECMRYKGNLIVVGDMNQNAHAANIVQLQSDGLSRLGFYEPDIIDHVLLSHAAERNYSRRRVRVDDTISTIDMLTDHPMVIANIA